MAGATTPATDRTRLGERYRLVECVRVDGARQCWRAVDEVLRRPVQIWLHRGLDLEAASAIRRRVQALHGMRHVGLVGVYDLVDQDDEVAVVAEPHAGRPLSDLLCASRGPSLGTARAIVSSLAQTLDDLYLADHTIAALDAGDVLLRAGGPAILDAPLAAPGQGAGRPDIHALEELARGLVLGSPPRRNVPEAVRLAVENARQAPGRFRSAREFAGNLASAIAFDDRTEVLQRERWVALRRRTEWVRTRALAAAAVLAFSAATGGLIASATTRPAEREATRHAQATAAAPAPTTAAVRAAPIAVRPGTTPSVIGLARDEAAAALITAGAGSVAWQIALQAHGVTRVVRQDPPAGQPLARGAKATLFLDSANAR